MKLVCVVPELEPVKNFAYQCGTENENHKWENMDVFCIKNLCIFSSVADSGSRILIFMHPDPDLRIPDSGFNNSNIRGGGENLLSYLFFVATKIIKFKIILFLIGTVPTFQTRKTLFLSQKFIETNLHFFLLLLRLRRDLFKWCILELDYNVFRLLNSTGVLF
jgi:hypothetical protein